MTADRSSVDHRSLGLTGSDTLSVVPSASRVKTYRCREPAGGQGPPYASFPKEFLVCLAPAGTWPAASEVVDAGMSYTIQWMSFWAVSMSCTRRATLATADGTLLHARGGDWLAPSHVNWRGIAAPSANAELLSWMVGFAELGDVAFFTEDPPPPQATPVTMRPIASVRSTGLFYPERGHVTDGVEPSAVTDDTEARDAEGLIVEAAGLEPIDTRTILRAGGPRFVANAGFPILFFYLGWKVSGLLLGVVLATAVGVAAYLYERHKERPGMVARLALAFVFIQGVVGLAFGSAKVYLAQPVILNLLLGLVFLVTTLRGKPFAGQFAEELYPFPPEVKESDTFKQVFARVSIVWAAYFLARSLIRLYMLQWSVDAFVVVNVLTGFPIIAALMSWSVWYISRSFRQSEEWGPALAGR